MVMTKRPAAPSEAAIVGLLISRLDELFSDLEAVCCEVRSHGTARADIAFTAADLLFTIEVKRSDWGRAIAQAHLNRLCSDMSFIAVWTDAVRPQLVKQAFEFGVGVLAIDDDGAYLVLAPRPSQPSGAVRARIMTALTSSVAS